MTNLFDSAKTQKLICKVCNVPKKSCFNMFRNFFHQLLHDEIKKTLIFFIRFHDVFNHCIRGTFIIDLQTRWASAGSGSDKTSTSAHLYSSQKLSRWMGSYQQNECKLMSHTNKNKRHRTCIYKNISLALVFKMLSVAHFFPYALEISC